MSELEDLVALYLERRELEDTSVEAFCAEHPEHGPELVRAIEASLEVGDLFEPLPRELDPSAAPGSARRRIGGWEIVREIGRGGMGVVYEAFSIEHPSDPRVAIKVLPNACLRGARALERFRREARVLEKLSDEHIVAVREVGTEGETPYFVMELVEGQPLTELIGALTPADIVPRVALMLARLARSVAAAHENGGDRRLGPGRRAPRARLRTSCFPPGFARGRPARRRRGQGAEHVPSRALRRARSHPAHGDGLAAGASLRQRGRARRGPGAPRPRRAGAGTAPGSVRARRRRAPASPLRRRGLRPRPGARHHARARRVAPPPAGGRGPREGRARTPLRPRGGPLDPRTGRAGVARPRRRARTRPDARRRPDPARAPER